MLRFALVDFDDQLDELVALARELDRDPVDVYEDLLAARLRLVRGPGLSLSAWRRQRVAFIEAAGEEGERLGAELAEELLRR